jgi:hypothetical protein
LKGPVLKHLGIALAVTLGVPLVLFVVLAQAPAPSTLKDPPNLRAQELRIDVTFHRSLLGSYSISVDNVHASPMRVTSWDRTLPDWHPFQFCFLACSNPHTATVTLQNDAGQSMVQTRHVNAFSLAGSSDRNAMFVFTDALPSDYHIGVVLETTDGRQDASLETTFQVTPG